MNPFQLKNSETLNEFIGLFEIKSLSELCLSKESGIYVVPGWYNSVVEGVDLWFQDGSSSLTPNYRMKVKVTHGKHDAVFVLFNENVERLAVETCPLLASMGESCSLFPDEMEVYYGEPMLFKVERSFVESEVHSNYFNVLGLCTEIPLLDMFFDNYFPLSNTAPSSSEMFVLPDIVEIPELTSSGGGCVEVEVGPDEVVSTVNKSLDVEVVSVKRKIEEVAADVGLLEDEKSGKIAKFDLLGDDN
ncbi:hypothetical protein P8452_01743 [Trifolium repens]|nr:hypothetical protein P8452_01743 [Trifolium repens]